MRIGVLAALFFSHIQMFLCVKHQEYNNSNMDQQPTTLSSELHGPINGYIEHQLELNQNIAARISRHGRAYKNTLPKQPKKTGTVEAQHVEIQVSFKFIRIVKIHVEQQSMTFHCEVTLRWFDTNLGWIPADFGDIRETKVESGKIWSPDVIIQNTLGVSVIESMDSSNSLAQLTHDGEICKHYSVIVTIPCDANAEDFPFDTHSCVMLLTSRNSKRFVHNLILGKFDFLTPF